MNLPHQCECRICGRTMGEAPGFVVPALGAPYPMGAAIIGTAMQYMCTKHGLIPTQDCEHCAAEAQHPPTTPERS